MIQTHTLEVFAQVAFGLAGVSGMVLILAGRGQGRLSSLDKARIAVLFQLTSVAFVLGIVPMTLHAGAFDDQQNLQISSLVMAVLLALVMLLTRQTYARARIEYAATVTGRKRLLFYGLLSLQLIFTLIVAAGLWDDASMTVYLAGLAVLLGLAFHQLLRFVRSEEFKRDNTGP